MADVTGSVTSDYFIKLYGSEIESGIEINSFAISSSVAAYTASAILNEPKRAFIGASRTNFTGTLLNVSDCRVGNFKYYGDALTEREATLHSKFNNTKGRDRPFENFNRSNRADNTTGASGSNAVYVPKFLSTIFEWDFEQVTTASDAGEFIVDDRLSGSLNLSGSYAGYGAAVDKSYPGLGFNFASGFKVYENEFVSKVKAMLPEESFGANKIAVATDTDIAFGINMAPAREASFVAKSMYDVISQDILNIFAGVIDFNNLIGNPVNKYRNDYKDLGRLRDLYFDRIQNDPDLDKFVTYFKWLDSVIYTVLDNAIPAATNLIGEQTNVVESHALERSKYAYKFPTLEYKVTDPTAVITASATVANRLPTSGSSTGSQNVVNLTNPAMSRFAYPVTGALNFASTSAGNYTKEYQVVGKAFTGTISQPLTIANRLPTTGSGTGSQNILNLTNPAMSRFGYAVTGALDFASASAGNYRFNYQVLNTVGRKENNLYIASEVAPALYISPYVSGGFDYSFPERNKTKSIIVQRFSAPGGANTSRGALDIAAREYSVYNAMPYRNLTVRTYLDEWYKIHELFGGYRSGSTTTASYHKINRNPRTVPKVTGTGSYSYKSVEFNNPAPDDSSYKPNYLSIPSSSLINDLDKLTISVWLMVTGTTRPGYSDYQQIVYLGDSAPEVWDLGLEDDDEFISLTVAHETLNGDWRTANDSFTRGVWHHLAVAYDGTNVTNLPRIFIDGESATVQNTTMPTGALLRPEGVSSIGIRATDHSVPFGGFMDEISIWNKALSDAELRELYHPKPPSISGPANLKQHSAARSSAGFPNGNLAVWWRLGEGIAGSAANYTILDELGRIPLTMTNFTASGADTFGVGDNPPSNSAGTLNKYTTYGTRQIYDNWFIQHMIPQSNLQYSWITASYLSTSDFGQLMSPTGSNITFVSASDVISYAVDAIGSKTRYFGIDKSLIGKTLSWQAAGGYSPTSQPIFVDFVGLNSVVVDPITSSQNHLGFPAGVFGFKVDAERDRIYYINPTIAGKDGVDNGRRWPDYDGTNAVLNAILLNRNGPYGYPSWKQIRTGENAVARAQRLQNVLSFPVYRTISGKTAPFPHIQEFVEFTNVSESVVSFHAPAKVELKGSGITLKTSYDNIKMGFANKTVQEKLHTFENRVKNNETFIDKVMEQPADSPWFDSIGLSQVIIPKSAIAGLNSTRTRPVFDNAWWRNQYLFGNRPDALPVYAGVPHIRIPQWSSRERIQVNVTNSMGQLVSGGYAARAGGNQSPGFFTSRWNMDSDIWFCRQRHATALEWLL